MANVDMQKVIQIIRYVPWPAGQHKQVFELRKGNTGMALTTLLIFIVNRVGDKMLPATYVKCKCYLI